MRLYAVKKRKPRRKQSKIKPMIPAIATAVVIHLAVILFFLYQPGHSKVSSKKSPDDTHLSSEKIAPPDFTIPKEQSNVSMDPVYPQEPKAISSPKPPEKNLFYWTDENGIKNFSDIRPATHVDNFEIRKVPLHRNANYTEVSIKANQVLVPVILGNGENAISTYLMLDTGATTTMIKRKFASMLNMKSLTPGTSRVADGRTVPSYLGNLDYIIVGPHKISNFKINVMDHQGALKHHQGLLGMNFLREVEYSVDFRREIISWE
jgi:predicted aspartyl protease